MWFTGLIVQVQLYAVFTLFPFSPVLLSYASFLKACRIPLRRDLERAKNDVVV
jgi:hypothetical protein